MGSQSAGRQSRPPLRPRLSSRSSIRLREIVIPDPLDNQFYVLSPRARDAWLGLPPVLKLQFREATRALEMGSTAENPFIYERRRPDASSDRVLAIYWWNICIYIRNVPHDDRYEVVDIELNPEPIQPGTFFP